jgi:hypothetical protein
MGWGWVVETRNIHFASACCVQYQYSYCFAKTFLLDTPAFPLGFLRNDKMERKCLNAVSWLLRCGGRPLVAKGRTKKIPADAGIYIEVFFLRLIVRGLKPE